MSAPPIRTIVAIGEGLAAGCGDFSTFAETQNASFPALLAKALGADFRVPALQAPGIQLTPGFPAGPVILPSWMQTRVFSDMPPRLCHHLAVPGFKVADSLLLRPNEPLVNRNDARQTAANLILGGHRIGTEEPSMSQLELAVQWRPDLALVVLGYTEFLEWVATANGPMPCAAGVAKDNYREIVKRLSKVGARIVLANIPDPFDTAFFSSLGEASEILRIDTNLLREAYGLNSTTLLTVHGLNEIGAQFFGRAIDTLPPGSTFSPDKAAAIRTRLAQWNAEIAKIAVESGAILYDLNALFRRIRQEGFSTPARRISGTYLGGFYSLNGFYPGATGHAIVAQDLQACLAQNGFAVTGAADFASICASDPVLRYQPARGAKWKSSDLPLPIPRRRTPPCGPGAFPPLPPASPSGILKLPPNLEQVLPLNPVVSYFGDGIAALNARSPGDIQWGSGGNWLFGGLAMVDSQLSGRIRIRFSPPAANRSQFRIGFEGGFTGEDATLSCPICFSMPFQHNRVDEVPGTISSGTLDLTTGEVSDLVVYAKYSSTALLSLVSVNPGFPKQPLQFPGQYGRVYARFDARPDGLLDFTFYGSTYVPLGNGTVWPLNFAGPENQFATVPANGTVMHPHLHLSTRASAPDTTAAAPAQTFNSVREFTLHTHNSAFGDKYTLNVPELEGGGDGRSHLLGRAQIQFGARTGDSVPVAIFLLGPGGVFGDLPNSPVTKAFPGTLSPGPTGFYEMLRFPLRTYSLDELAVLSDPLDICMGSLNLRTGQIVNPMVNRVFYELDLIFAVMRVEPLTPKSSFEFGGPASFENGAGERIFRFAGTYGIPYDEGFLFPQPDLSTAFVVGPNSRLDPFLWLQAMDSSIEGGRREGGGTKILSSTGELFSYRYAIPPSASRGRAQFIYENHTQNGRFELTSLAWINFSNSRGGNGGDTLTLSGYGVWSKAGVQTVQPIAAQICKSPDFPYVGIQIGNSDVSNANTKPLNDEDAEP